RRIVSIAYEVRDGLPGTYEFIDDNFKFLAASFIFAGPQLPGLLSYPIKITNDNKITKVDNATNTDVVISNNLGISQIYSSPTACNLDNYDSEEIIVSADNKIFAINKFGVVLDNFPFSVASVNSITSGIAVADLNDDNIADLVFGTGDGRVYAYGIDGKILEGFPLTTGGTITSTPAIINNNGYYGIVVYSQDGYLYGWKTQWLYNNIVYWKNYLTNSNHHNHGTGFFLTEPSLSCLPADKVYNWPNPAYGKSTNIRYYLGGDVTAVNIKIMDLAGELVTTLKGTTNKGFDNEVPWDITNVQSGIYVAVVQPVGGCGETATIKIAVVK
ncbi:MAG TPA: T9SS type A sorting domain-containing protein, partial [Ignavibacteria bacterium]